MTTLRELVLKIHEDLNDNLNTYIGSTQAVDEDWFEPLSFVPYAPDWETEEDWFKMGIYLSSPNGAVYTSNSKASNITVALDCLLDNVREHSALPQLYLSAVVDYLRKKNYGDSSNVSFAQIVRTDLDAPVNAFSVAINVTVYSNDMDLDF